MSLKFFADHYVSNAARHVRFIGTTPSRNESIKFSPVDRPTAKSDALCSRLRRGDIQMKKDDKIIPSGPFKGKRIEFAPTTGVDMLLEISEDFMRRIFDFEPGEYLITDESSLFDFTGVDEMELSDIQQKIRDVYDIDVSDVESGNLLEIFTRIHHRKYVVPS